MAHASTLGPLAEVLFLALFGNELFRYFAVLSRDYFSTLGALEADIGNCCLKTKIMFCHADSFPQLGVER
jgi:hypothetical protein